MAQRFASFLDALGETDTARLDRIERNVLCADLREEGVTRRFLLLADGEKDVMVMI
jgi:hypothetical protein